MQIIQNNPYRTVGLLVGATAREKDKQIRRLRQFLDAEQDIQDDFSFPALGNFRRTVESVDDAASKLNLDSDKMFAALFWFYKGNPISDEPALDFLKEDAPQNSIEIWSKLTNAKEVTQRNGSAFQNLSTLLLYNAFNGKEIDTNLLEKAICLKLQFLESDFIKDFKTIATDETYKTTKKEVQLLFLNQVQTEILVNGGISANKFLEIVNKQEFSAKEDYLKTFVSKQLQDISKEIEAALKARKNSASTAHEVGKTLISKTKSDLSFLKSVLSENDFQYQNIADKLSYEIVQCGIDHFNATKTDGPFLNEYEFAYNIAVSPRAKERAKENWDSCKDWIKNKDLYNCWFCGNNPPEDSSKFSTTIYKVQSRAYKKVQYSYAPFTIPRCNECQKIHSQGSEKFGFVLVGCIVAGLVIGFLADGYWFGGLLVGGAVGWLLGTILQSQNSSKVGIKDISNSTIIKYPVLNLLIKEGWQLSKPTA